MAVNDITNVSASQTGTQRLGTVTVKVGSGAENKNTRTYGVGTIGHIGSYENPVELNVADIDQTHDNNFINEGNKFFINEGTGLASIDTFYQDGMWGLWRNSNDGLIVIAVNASGTIRTGTLS